MFIFDHCINVNLFNPPFFFRFAADSYISQGNFHCRASVEQDAYSPYMKTLKEFAMSLSCVEQLCALVVVIGEKF